MFVINLIIQGLWSSMKKLVAYEIVQDLSPVSALLFPFRVKKTLERTVLSNKTAMLSVMYLNVIFSELENAEHNTS